MLLEQLSRQGCHNIFVISGSHLVYHASHDGDHQRHYGLHVRLLHGPHSPHQDQPQEDLGGVHRGRHQHGVHVPGTGLCHVSGELATSEAGLSG